MVSIKGLLKDKVLLALWNASKCQGISFMGFAPLSAGQAYAEVINRRQTYKDGKTSIYFDYLNGRVLKVDIGGDEFDERLYDRDNGEGAAQRAIDALRAQEEETE